jgi:hypothetical protein
MGSSDVDFFIHSYYEFKLFGVTLSINGHDSNCLSDIIGFDIICQT